MLSEIVNIGDKIELKQLDNRGELMKSSKTYVSQMIDYVEDNIITIATPIKNGVTVILEREAGYRLYFYTNKGLYQCDCTMLQTYRENNMVLAAVKIISEPKKIQRRQYYRLECVQEIQYRVVTEEERRLEERLANGKFADSDEKAEISKKLSDFNKKWNYGSIIDLSGGGCRFNSDEQLKPGDRIRIRLELMTKKGLKKLDIFADTISSLKIIDRVGYYEHRAEFYNITEKDREDLIKYIFEQERRLRKNDKK